ncbi:extensin family protein [uncultured Maritalea sp.]|uniref:extensin family protein n=1 Tax=uncultured Maritalea sp. TaxID=757249 RepID=UPI002617164C|nr:extensin family protein [uncultured Maritalea sp.]
MTPHNNAKLGDYAETVLLPGDPLRAKWVAETFLEDAKQVNSVRNCLGYTGTFNGKQVSVAKGWKGRRSERLFLRDINDGACGHFTTVLGPRADKFHQDHFHFDLARHGKSGNRRVCK